MAQRGRPKDTPVEEIIKYTQVIKHNDGEVTTWYWDKSISIDGPIKTVTKWPKGALDFDFKKKTFNSLSAVIKTASVDTENKKRDKHLRSDGFFDSSKFPQIKFMMTSYKKTADDEGVMTGKLTMKGVTKSITLDVEELATQTFKGKNRVFIVYSPPYSYLKYFTAIITYHLFN